MPSTLKIRIVQARDLPVMDKQNNSTDAYVQLKFGESDETQQTDIVFRSLQPVFNADFRIEVADDVALQDHPVVFKVWDKDTYSADDAIGTVIVDLNPLLIPDGPSKISGWLPIYDTLRGIRGRLFVIIKIMFFHDMNPFKESSAGVPIYGLSFPRRQCVHGIHGFVEELVVERDTEYEWTDMFRTSRKSNEARQLLLYRLSSRIRRNVGRKSLEKGGQAVLGYVEAFDLESSSGALIARGFGTACTVHKIDARQVQAADAAASTTASPLAFRERPSTTPKVSHLTLTPSAATVAGTDFHDSTAACNVAAAGAPANTAITATATITPLSILTAASLSGAACTVTLQADPFVDMVVSAEPTIASPPSPPHLVPDGPARLSKAERGRLFRTDEVQLLTLVQLPSDVHIRLGGVVVARSVKHLGSSSADQATRDTWWSELREEIQGHARALSCSSVVGYTETTSIYEDIVVLSCYGTAANCGRLRACGLELSGSAPMELGSSFPPVSQVESGASASSLPGSPSHRIAAAVRPSPIVDSPNSAFFPPAPLESSAHHSTVGSSTSPATAPGASTSTSSISTPALNWNISSSNSVGVGGAGVQQKSRRRRPFACSACHIPYARDATPFRVALSACQICKRRMVPELLLATIEPPQHMPVAGAGIFVESRVCRAKRRTAGTSTLAAGEAAAAAISEAVPFLEYELHRQLLYKLRVLGMNAAFRLQLQLTIGAQLIVGVMSATAVYLPALPPPVPLKITRHIETKDKEDESYNALQRGIVSASEANCEAMQARAEHWREQQLQRLRPRHQNRTLSTSASATHTTTASSSQQSAYGVFGGRNTSAALSAVRMSPTRARGGDTSSSSSSSESSDSSTSSDSDDSNDAAKQTFILHIDDDVDEDAMASILDPRPPVDVLMCTTEIPPGISRPPSSAQMLTMLRRVTIPLPLKNQTFAAIFHDLQAQMCFRVRRFAPCALSGMRITVSLPSESTVELTLTATVGMLDRRSEEVREFIAEQSASKMPFLLPPMIAHQRAGASAGVGINSSPTLPLQLAPPPPPLSAAIAGSSATSSSSSSSSAAAAAAAAVRAPLGLAVINVASPVPKAELAPTIRVDTGCSSAHKGGGDNVSGAGAASPSAQRLRPLFDGEDPHADPEFVEITPLTHVPASLVEAYLGRLQLHLIKETWSYREQGGLSAFAHTFVSEAHAMARAHVAARGGNALLSFRLHECRFVEVSKTQAYSIISLSGDCVRIARAGAALVGHQRLHASSMLWNDEEESA